MKRVVGLDLSLTSTGVATSTYTKTIQPKRLTSYQRLRYIKESVLEMLNYEQPDLVIVEGPSFGSVGRGMHERGGLWWMVTELVDAHGFPLAVAPPPNVKKYATGSGNADKDKMVLAAARHFDWFAGNNDEADALWLCAVGHEYLHEPIADVPAAHKAALNGCEWPVVEAA